MTARGSDAPPPFFAALLLKIVASARDYDFAAGDLRETYEAMAAMEGRRRARAWFRREVLKAFPGFFKNTLYRRAALVRNDLFLALRNSQRNSLFAVINLLGLAVGMACFILIALWIRDERSFDSFHAAKDRLFLLTIIHPNGGADPNVPYALAPRLAGEVPEIETFTRLFRLANLQTCAFRAETDQGEVRQFYERSVDLVDPAFFSMFSFPFKYGDPETVLKNPAGLVLSETAAAKYFGTANPVGRTMTLNGRSELVVTGVISVPSNSHLRPDFTIPLPNRLDSDWNWRDPSYVLLREGVSSFAVAERIASSLNRLHPGPLPGTFRVALLPLADVYLGFGRRTYVHLFSVVAVLVLLIACINYMNLATACSSSRTKEVGIRKVLGARRAELVRQFFSESLFIAATGLLLSFILVRVGLPLLNGLTGKHLRFSELGAAPMILLLLGLWAAVGLVAGSYPALVLSAGRPARAFGSSWTAPARRSWFRVVTVVGQFAISILLIVGTGAVFQQLRYIRNRPLGLNTESVIKIPIVPEMIGRYGLLRNALLGNPKVRGVTAGQAVPYDEDYKTGGAGLTWEGKDPSLNALVRYSIGLPGYVETFGLEIVQGGSFPVDNLADLTGYLINEEAARYMGFSEPVGKRITFWGASGPVIGVVKNYHHVSLHREILPQVFTANPRHYGALRFLFVKIAPDGVPETLDQIREVFRTLFPDAPFETIFLDQEVGNLYESERRLGRIFRVSTFVAVLISCLGIFGLASFMAEKRTKEVGIRKVLGASVPALVVLLSREFSRWLVLANVIAWPVGWLAVHRWLQNFAYRTGVSLWLFASAAVLSAAVAALPVVYHAARAAWAEPVDSLRYE
jgi:putative ABC transport system permease protein